MKSICIKTNDCDLIEYLLNSLNDLDLDSVFFSCKQFKNYKNIIIHYKGSNAELFISKISSILSLLVIDELEESLLNRIIINNYFYFDTSERNEIINKCSDYMSDNFTSIFDKKFNALFNSFYNFLLFNNSLILKGFTNFRIKSYLCILDDIIGVSVNDFIVEKEYLEFISLLKLYVNSQASTCEVVHLIYSDIESILLNEEKKIITISNDTFSTKYLSDISFSSNDYTLNSLLTLLPKKIYIHLIDNTIDEFINTLKSVFEDRIIICTDCNICRLYKNSVKKKSPNALN